MANRQIVITPNDYTNLTEQLSEKNIIYAVTGNEYKIAQLQNNTISINNNTLTNLTDNTTLTLNGNSVILNPNTVNNIFTSSPYTSSNAKANANLQSKSGIAQSDTIKIYGRTESLYLKGSFTFETNDISSQINPSDISCSFIINYTQSDYKTNSASKSFTNWTYNIQHATQFFNNTVDPTKKFPILENIGDDNLTLEQNEFLPMQNTNLYVSQYGFSNRNTMNIEIPNEPQYVRCKDIEDLIDSAKITIEYNICIWAGWCNHNVNLWGISNIEEIVLGINNITLQFNYPIVTTNSRYFKYSNNTKNETVYELEDSELMLYAENTPQTSKISYKVSNEILTNYNKNRRIISFDLLNPKKYEIDESENYDISENNLRFIQENDIFTMYDEHNNLMGDFRVIKCNPKWDGSYHILITAILIINEE